MQLAFPIAFATFSIFVYPTCSISIFSVWRWQCWWWRTAACSHSLLRTWRRLPMLLFSVWRWQCWWWRTAACSLSLLRTRCRCWQLRRRFAARRAVVRLSLTSSPCPCTCFLLQRSPCTRCLFLTTMLLNTTKIVHLLICPTFK
jgi:hypothetical protein